jgi:hypothetical protein
MNEITRSVNATPRVAESVKRHIMPNWCENSLILQCNDPFQIQRAVKAYNENRLLWEFFEHRNTLCDLFSQVNPSYEFFPQLNECDVDLESDDWRLQNWGTVSDIGDDSSIDSDSEDPVVVSNTAIDVTFQFYSRWTPPVKGMRALEAAGISVALYYCEPNMRFCGLYRTDGGDHRYDIPDIVDEVREKLPNGINAIFGIYEFDEE